LALFSRDACLFGISARRYLQFEPQQRSKKKKREGSPKRVSAMKEKNKGTTPQWDDAFC
jgi:hypothetical protein